MVQYSLRLLKRFIVLVPGIVVAYFLIEDIFPYFDRRLPLGIAIFITYVLGAYVLVPAAIRLFRTIRPPKHVPLYCVTPDGFASDPLNIGIIGTRRELILAMERAGWHIADRHSPLNVARMAFCIALGRDYPAAPVSSLYLFGRKQDIAFEIPIGGNPSSRHHVRFWATTYEKKELLNIRCIHWQHRRMHVLEDNLLWVGAASLDVGVSVIRHNLQVSHMIDPDTNTERDMIVQQLQAQGLVKKLQAIELGEPYRLINRVLRGSLHTDGKMSIVTLNTKKPPAETA